MPLFLIQIFSRQWQNNSWSVIINYNLKLQAIKKSMELYCQAHTIQNWIVKVFMATIEIYHNLLM